MAASLANFGEDTAFATILPHNDIGRAALCELRGMGVDTKPIFSNPGAWESTTWDPARYSAPAKSSVTGLIPV